MKVLHNRTCNLQSQNVATELAACAAAIFRSASDDARIHHATARRAHD